MWQASDSTNLCSKSLTRFTDSAGNGATGQVGIDGTSRNQGTGKRVYAPGEHSEPTGPELAVSLGLVPVKQYGGSAPSKAPSIAAAAACALRTDLRSDGSLTMRGAKS
jgi:hypothetical protein